MLTQVITDYNEAVFDTDTERALAVVRDAVSNGVSPEDIVFKVVIPALSALPISVDERQGSNLAQYFVTTHIASMVTTEMVARFASPPVAKGPVVLGNAYGDLHPLGKRIVMGCLKARMIEVIDLGVNVRPEAFVEAAISCNASVIGISAMMLHTARGKDGCLKVREILNARGLESRIKIIVGGAAFRFDPELYRTVNADAWAADGVTAGKVIEELIRGGQP